MCNKISTALCTGLLALSAATFSAPTYAATGSAKGIAPEGFTCIAPVDLGKVVIKIGDIHYKNFSLGLSPRSTGQESVILRLGYTVNNTGNKKRLAYFQMIGVRGEDNIDFAMSEVTVLGDRTTATENQTTDAVSSPDWNINLTLLCYRADAF